MSEIKFNLSDQCLYCGVNLPPKDERTYLERIFAENESTTN